jgi:hypothetical protein
LKKKKKDFIFFHINKHHKEEEKKPTERQNLARVMRKIFFIHCKKKHTPISEAITTYL